MPNVLEIDVADFDFDFALDFDDGESARVGPAVRGRHLLAGGLLALAAATSAGVPAVRVAPQRAVDEYMLSYQPGTGTSTGIRSGLLIDLDAADDSLSTAESILAELRSVLGLNIAETARVVGVERPTIYAWLGRRSIPQRANGVRLARLEGVVGMWRRLATGAPGPLVRAPGSNGRSLVDLLALDPIPETLVESRMREIARVETAPRRPSVREIAERHGLATRSRAESQREIDWLTRRPFGAEES
jgi:hypothetical protein